MHSGVFENAEENFAALVDPEEALACVLDDLGREGLPVLDEGLLDDLEHLVGAAAHARQVVEDLRQLKQVEVPVQALVHQLLLHQLPELVVLESHGGSALNEVD